MTRSEGDEIEEEKKYLEEELVRVMDQYVDVGSKGNRNMFSNQNPEILFDTLIEFAESTGSNYNTSKDKYKMKMDALVKIEKC